eukprot:2700667-Pleurochrysis_carterae.AAC.1
MQIAVPTDLALASLTKRRRLGADVKHVTNGCATHAIRSRRRRLRRCQPHALNPVMAMVVITASQPST